MEDDLEAFPFVARIPDAMLHKVDPAHPVLVAYLTKINPFVAIGVLLRKGIVGTSKRGKGSKKFTKANPSKSSPVHTAKKVSKSDQAPELTETKKEFMPSKSSVLKRTKKMAHRPLHFPEKKKKPGIEVVPDRLFLHLKRLLHLRSRKFKNPR